MSLIDSNARTKRKLDFHDKPMRCKSFYVDIKAETVRRKIVRRIKELGGHVEDFLSKDIDLFLTDKKSEELERATSKGTEKQQISSKNLSRGRALLLKACAQSNHSTTASSSSIIQNAINLGVKVEQACVFYKESNKFTQCLKKSSRRTNEIDGISPLDWKENEKENTCCIKVEDTGQLYKPLFKDFDKFPTLYYNDEVASPFVKGVVLTKHKEKAVNRYSTAKKTENVTNKGGFCEACDYWYRCSLREHIKSAKHEKFVKDQTNFEMLDTIISKLPSVSDFIKKLDHIAGTLNKHSPSYIVSQQIFERNTCILENNQQKEEEIVPTETDMPSIGKEQPERVDLHFEMQNANIDINKESSMFEEFPVKCRQDEELPSYCIALNASSHINDDVVIQDSEMPSLHKEYPYDTNTRDSGTGPELPDLTVSNQNSLKRTNSDSALPPDDEVMMCCSPNINVDCSNDNAVFMEDIIHKSTTQLIENVTSNVRQRFSKITLLEDVEFTSEKSDNTSFVCRKYEGEMMTLKQEGPFCFSDISSPNNKAEKPFSFNDLASNWIKDIGKASSHMENKLFEEKESGEHMNCEYSSATEEYNPQDFKILKSTHTCQAITADLNEVDETEIYNISDNSTENYKYEDFRFGVTKKFSSFDKSLKSDIKRGITADENSCSLDSVSLISMPDTPKRRKLTQLSFGMSESSNSLSNIADDTICANECDTSTVSVISEITPLRQKLASELNHRIANSELSDLSQNSGYCHRKTTEQKPIKIKINLSEIKKKEKKNKRKVKVKRRIFPDEENTKENEETFYLTHQESDTKIKLCKVAKTPVQKNGDLMTYWKVRKSGGCRLVFSSEKRKACDLESDTNDKILKRRKCIF